MVCISIELTVTKIFFSQIGLLVVQHSKTFFQPMDTVSLFVSLISGYIIIVPCTSILDLGH